jgi:hypothetical protein
MLRMIHAAPLMCCMISCSMIIAAQRAAVIPAGSWKELHECSIFQLEAGTVLHEMQHLCCFSSSNIDAA